MAFDTYRVTEDVCLLVPRSARVAAFGEEREEISRGLVAGNRVGFIGRRIDVLHQPSLGRSPSTGTVSGIGRAWRNWRRRAGRVAQACETQHAPALARAGRDEASVAVVSSADRWLAQAHVPRHSELQVSHKRSTCHCSCSRGAPFGRS